jgi:hypothetical protein
MRTRSPSSRRASAFAIVALAGIMCMFALERTISATGIGGSPRQR